MFVGVWIWINDPNFPQKQLVLSSSLCEFRQKFSQSVFVRAASHFTLLHVHSITLINIQWHSLQMVIKQMQNQLMSSLFLPKITNSQKANNIYRTNKIQKIKYDVKRKPIIHTNNTKWFIKKKPCNINIDRNVFVMCSLKKWLVLSSSLCVSYWEILSACQSSVSFLTCHVTLHMLILSETHFKCVLRHFKERWPCKEEEEV